MYDTSPELSPSTARVGAGFFQIDRRAWAHVCGLGLNAAVTYLVLATGTGPDNRTTSWSIHAVETRTGISRGRVRAAIDALKDAGVIRQLAEGTKPHYFLEPAHVIPGCEGYPLPDRDMDEERIYTALLANSDWIRTKDLRVAAHLERKGWIKRRLDGWYEAVRYDPEKAAQSDWIWLPNALVNGLGAGPSPVELVRQTRDVLMLRLLIDLYHVHDLSGEGGVNRKHFYRQYDRVQVGQQAEYDVLGFRYTGISANWTPLTLPHRPGGSSEDTSNNDGQDFFARLEGLVRLGLLEWVPVLFEGDDLEAEMIHPCGMGESASLEDRIGAAADRAGQALLTEGQQRYVAANNLWLVPVKRHLSEATLVGIARLRFRPHTRMTSAWWLKLQEASRYLAIYRNLAARRAA